MAQNNSDTYNNRNTDLTDSANDEKHLQADTTTMDMPEVKDIPGQEHFKRMPMGEMADTTAASDDEEGVGIVDELDADEENSIIIAGPDPDEADADDSILEDDADDEDDEDTDVTEEDKALLNQHGPVMEDSDSDNLRRSMLDNTDEDGELLNEEASARSIDGEDLDVPGAELDDEDEEIGEEDEENNLYSQADTD